MNLNKNLMYKRSVIDKTALIRPAKMCFPALKHFLLHCKLSARKLSKSSMFLCLIIAGKISIKFFLFLIAVKKSAIV